MERIKKRRKGFTRLSSQHQVTIPAETVEQAGLAPGDELRVEVDRAGRIIMSRPPDVESRLKALEHIGDRFAGVWEPGALEKLRDEWR